MVHIIQNLKIILLKIIERPWWWLIILCLPIVGNIVGIVILYEWLHVFGYRKKRHTFYAIVTLGIFLLYVNYSVSTKYIGRDNESMIKSVSSWTSAVLFAVVAATIVHSFFIQPFTIPSSSLEKSLLVGDFLFVSKFHYGARVPMTPIAFPMIHDTIPIVKKKSYLFDDRFDKRNTSWKNKFQLPYMRLPGFEKIERNDIVVFNQPADTLLDMNDFHPDRNYYKPIDKKTNLVKRCVGIAGDSLEVRDGFVYINGKKNELPDRAHLQFSYYVQPKTNQFNPNVLKKLYDITDGFGIINNQNTYYFSAISDEALAKFKDNPNVVSITPNIKEKGVRDPNIFPHDTNYNWNVDQFGPLYIPEEGKTIDINLDILPLYKRVISEYEGNTLQVKGNQIFINGKATTSYTFKQNYYWMMGDNRHNSIDARAWGFVPFDHVVGKPVFIWMSWDGIKNPRLERFFTTVGGTGKATSYFIPFLVLLFGWIGYNKWRKRKKANN